MEPRTPGRALDADLIVVGGGLAGLIAAALVARAGRSVIVLERAAAPGGRAVTQVQDGVHFNLGPHALYRRGHAFGLMRELGVPFGGGVPRPGRAMALAGDSLMPLPLGPLSLVTTPLLELRDKWRFARLPGRLARLDTRALDGVALQDWIGRTAGGAEAGRFAALLGALFRVSTYSDDPEHMSAGAAIDQLKSALAGNVWYLDGGWQNLVDGVAARAASGGAELRTHARVESVRSDANGVSVQLATGAAQHARNVILAVAPQVAVALLEQRVDAPLARFAATCVPVQAASLDVALHRLPRPEVRFALGLERPLYYSVHSAAAKLGPPGVAVLHVMKYLGQRSSASTARAAPREVEAELEAFLERLQPGWRAHVITRRFLPEMQVAPSLPLAAAGGLRGRPAVSLREHPGVFLAGDWVGARGLLADASAASAEEAARLVLASPAARFGNHGSVVHAAS